ncbi:hypothetical protein K505DRAFT_61104 [Melanomma pulvis-pyrius CBS 109.77]|uniref:Uncharacterized protein n=1 Tax=Melanomma pulvis-pyrius CBS 109.77 TaxID=1314802 RepID=A0A6A6X6B1_9PLEO|nr:hypothetical protein K505DRAFT_61104 [Melanomma pulvis-pyrius CBS 109.77]
MSGTYTSGVCPEHLCSIHISIPRAREHASKRTSEPQHLLLLLLLLLLLSPQEAKNCTWKTSSGILPTPPFKNAWTETAWFFASLEPSLIVLVFSYHIARWRASSRRGLPRWLCTCCWVFPQGLVEMMYW